MRSVAAFTLCVAAAVAAAAAPPLCFTAHEKLTLYCAEPPASDGPLLVYDDGELPQRARQLWWRSAGGRLCTSKGCGKCVAPGRAGRTATCRSAGAAGWVLARDRANSLLARPASLALGAALLLMPVAALVLSLPAEPLEAKAARYASQVAAQRSPTPSGPILRAALAMLQYAGAWWFPWVAAFGTAINLFTLVLTAATVVLYLAAVLARPQRWVSTAATNAVGAASGSYILLLLLRSRGQAFLTESFGAVLANPAYAKLMGLMKAYGVVGMLGVSTMPLILHPIIVFGVVSGMSDASIIGIILAGRTIKYLIMAWVTKNAPGALRYFGIKASLFDMAAQAKAD